MKAAVLDASIGVKLVCHEAYSANALTLLQTNAILHAPAHWLAEAATGVWSKVAVHRLLSVEEMQPRLDFLSSLPVVVAGLGQLIGRAGALSLEMRLTLYDTLYLALAERLDVPFVTDDRRLIEGGARQSAFKGEIVWVGDLPSV